MTAIGYVRKWNNDSYRVNLKTVSIQAEIDILSNLRETVDGQPDYRVLTQGIRTGAAWIKRGETSGKEYVNLEASVRSRGDDGRSGAVRDLIEAGLNELADAATRYGICAAVPALGEWLLVGLGDDVGGGDVEPLIPVAGIGAARHVPGTPAG